MIGPRITSVFRSRWNALLWAAGVLVTAYCTVPGADDDAQAPTQSASPAHVNPWAKTPPAPPR